MKVVQVKLKHNNSTMVTWVNFDKKIKIGNTLSLREDKSKFYDIVGVYKTMQNEQINMEWNVGGLTKNQH